MILIISCTSKHSYALNDIGVYICETIPTAKWFRLEMRGDKKKFWWHKSFGVCEKFGGCTRNLEGAREIWGVHEKSRRCTNFFGMH
jgi:hypothetical protein